MTEYIKIHGDKWKLSDIKESVEWTRKQNWKKQKWLPRPALRNKGSISDYVGQKYNSEYTKYIEDGWTHDHCEICWWSIHEDENLDHGIGYTNNGHQWLCVECYNKFIV